ncbi:hypothetical protein [Staphylococcus phage vB_SauM-V1SA19]|nr:hypothetical protein [Staphylococcus phage vB_SauM-V1SA19]
MIRNAERLSKAKVSRVQPSGEYLSETNLK